MKKIYCFLLAAFFLSAGCITAPTNNSAMFGFGATEYKPTNEVLCQGGGLRFGNCIARQMSDSTCIGIAKFNGAYVALQIPCSVMFQNAIDTMILENDFSEATP